MLTKRIIPCLDVRNGRVVKGKKFKDIVDVDDPATLGKFYSDSGADELVFYDITASNEERKTSLEFVKRVAEEINIPFCVGGGVSTIDDFTNILLKGADKVSVNSSAVKNPQLIREASEKFGAQCVVLSMDAKKNDEGSWSVYVKDLTNDQEFDLGSQSLYSASLIKAFVMAQTYANMDTVLQSEAAKMKKDVSDPAVATKVNDLLWNMITVSDNESFNELVRLQTTSGVFKDGAEAVNAFLAENQFADTSVQHTLSPSASKDAGLGGRNTTSVKDCEELLSRIYKGECVSKEASDAMLNLLLNQQVTTKIPSGISASVEIANKTGETDTDQHDIAIVYGEKTTYILCVMSENCKSGDAVSHIQDISGIVYNYLNMQLDQK